MRILYLDSVEQIKNYGKTSLVKEEQVQGVCRLPQAFLALSAEKYNCLVLGGGLSWKDWLTALSAARAAFPGLYILALVPAEVEPLHAELCSIPLLGQGTLVPYREWTRPQQTTKFFAKRQNKGAEERIMKNLNSVAQFV